MIQSYGRRFEFFVVATIISLVALVALDRYTVMIKDAKVLRLEVISQHFMTAAANVRTKFLLSQVAKASIAIKKGLLVDGKLIYVSEDGWPASTSTPVSSHFLPTDEDCYHLWQVLFQNPAPITLGRFTESSHKYRVFAEANACRYALTDQAAYFDYFPLTGRLSFSAISN